jgi:hypothetical protein
LLGCDTFEAIGYEGVRKSVRSWARGECRHYLSIPAPAGVQVDAMESLVTELVRNGAAAGGESTSAALPVGANPACMAHLVEHHYLRQLSDGSWQFTELSMSSLRAKWMATAPSLVMVRRKVPVKEFTNWELCDYLLADDWTLHPLPATGKGHLGSIGVVTRC